MRNSFIILLLNLTLSLSGATYYVKNTGNDFNTGLSDAQAWKTIAKVNSASFSPGDIIAFKKGDIWTENIYTGLYPARSGVSGNPIVFTSYGTGANPVIANTSAFDILVTNRDYLTFKGLTLDGTSLSYGPMKIDGTSDHIVVEDCLFQNGGGTGISIHPLPYASYVTVRNCVFANVGQAPAGPPHGIYCSSANNLFENNVFYGIVYGFGIHCYNGPTLSVNNNIIRYNYIYNCLAGIIASYGDGNQVYYNIVNASTAKHAWGIEVSHATNTLVYNNTVYDTPYLGLGINNSTGTIVRNNILYGNGINYENLGTGTVYSNNLTTNPSFLNAGGSYLLETDFDINSSSAAINAGLNVGLTTDYAGRTIVGIPDIGAFESSIKVSDITVTGAGGANSINTSKGTLQLSSAVSPSNASNKTVTWSISNGTGQASISTTGLVTAIANGTVTARATASDGSGVYGTIVITISIQVIAVTGITVTGAGGATTITKDNGILQLSVSILPANATSKTITWSISNGSGQASISATAGLVTAITNGTVTAKATANDGSGVYGTLVITISNQDIPVYVLSTIENTTPSILEMKYNLNLANIIPPVSAFSVRVNSAARTVNSVTVSGTRVLLTLSSPVVYGDIVTVSYTQPSSNQLRTASNGLAVTIGAQAVTNNIINDAPKVEITSPVNNSKLTDITNITITADALDTDGSITLVEFFSNNTYIGTKSTAPYTFSWNNVVAGTYTLTVIATDNQNAKTRSSPISISVNDGPLPLNQSPVVTIYNPRKGYKYEAPATIEIQVTASDPDGTISRVELYNGTDKLTELSAVPYSFVWKDIAKGTYMITAVATDNLNATTATLPVEFTVGEATLYDANSKIVNLYPNPSDGHFSIEFINPLQAEKGEIRITSLAGKLVYSGPILKEEIVKQFDLSYIKSGIYVMMISDKEILVTKKIIIK